MNNQMPRGCYVMLHIGAGPSRAEGKSGPLLVVTGSNRFPLSDEIWIERLDEQLAKSIQRACEPPHHRIDVLEQDRHLYAFLRRVSDAETSKYEGMEELHKVVALSRLVHPTSVGDRYSALVFHLGLDDSAILAIQHWGISPDVFLSSKQRNWLSVQDGEELRELMPWLSNDKQMHDRVDRAYWNHEYAMHSFHVDMRWPLVVSGLEALISVGERNLGRQFRGRVRQLADEFGIDLTDDDLKSAWCLRSKIVHAERFLVGLEHILPKSQQNDLYAKLECLLRATVKRCLLDETFGTFFRSDDTVRARWPL